MKMPTAINLLNYNKTPPSQVLGFTEVGEPKLEEAKPIETQPSMQTPTQTLMQTRVQTRMQIQTQTQQQTRLPGYLRKVVTKTTLSPNYSKVAHI